MSRAKLIARAKHVAKARLELTKAIPVSDGDLGSDKDASLFAAESHMHDWLAALPKEIRRDLEKHFQPGQIP